MKSFFLSFKRSFLLIFLSLNLLSLGMFSSCSQSTGNSEDNMEEEFIEDETVDESVNVLPPEQGQEDPQNPEGENPYPEDPENAPNF